MRTSAGTLGFVANSSKGSPGAKARIVNRTALIPASTGIEISVRRSRYFDTVLVSGRAVGQGPEVCQDRSRLIPVWQPPQIRVPATQIQAPQLGRRDGDAV